MKTEQRALESKASCGFGATQVFSMHITGLYFLLVMQGCRCVCRLVGKKQRKKNQGKKQTSERLPQPPLRTSTLKAF